jgi:hypothetical protein
MKVTFNNGAAREETVDIDADEVRYTSSLVKFFLADVLLDVFSLSDVVKVDLEP